MTGSVQPAANMDQEGGRSLFAREELRLAVVLNGGVSLAIWMGGVAHEIDRLARATRDPESDAPEESKTYRTLLEWAGSTARVDVITGTSAGGINGAALALSTCNEKSRGLGDLRNTWVESGSISQLLRDPFRGSPPSLLKGDEFFLPELTKAMRGLTVDYEPTDVASHPVDLAITCTLLNGVPAVVTDASGQPVGQVRHDGLFRFQRGPTHRQQPGDDDFDAKRIADAARALALASRTTASYPVAFEPSLIPTTSERDKDDVAADYRPDMSGFMGGAWDDAPEGPQARYAVDGGVLANTPTRPALEAIDRLPVTGPVRRVVLLVHPHAPRPGDDQADTEAPTLVKAGGSLMKAIMSQGSRNYVDEIERHNQLAAGRRQLRADVIRQTTPDTLAARAADVSEWYWAKREDRITRDLARIWTKAKGEADRRPLTSVAAQIREWIQSEGWPRPASRGFEGALGLADAATDYLKRRCWVDPEPSVNRARATVSDCRDHLLRRRSEFTTAVKDAIRTDRDLPSWLEVVKTMYEVSAGTDLDSTIAGIAAALSGLPAAPGTTRSVASLQSPPDTKLLTDFHALIGLDLGANAPTVSERLQDLDTLSYVLSDEITTGASLPVDLVQLTFNVQHRFAPALTGEEKVAGDLLGRFSGFLKRSWRINDWAWGRLDAIETLCRVVLDPARVRHYLALQELAGLSPQELAARLYEELFPPGHGDTPPGIPTKEEVGAELESLLNADASAAHTEDPLTKLRRVFATRMALDVAREDLPALLDAVTADREEGANQRARGAVAVQTNATVYRQAQSGDPAQCWEALTVFGRSGIGREALTDEASSDQTIATLAKGAAVAINVADSDRSGLGFAKSVTSALRGAALLPYWSITGLTSAGALARGVALGALAVGGVLLALGLFGLGPTWGVAVGAGTVLGVFAYSALRTGTVLHGTVLLLPAVGLLAWAGYTYQQSQADASGAEADATTGLAVLLAVLGLAAALALLGALKAPLRSPQAWASEKKRWMYLIVFVVLLVLLIWVLVPANREAIGEYAQVNGSATGAIGETIIDGVPLGLWIALAIVAVVASGVYAWWIGINWRLVVRSGPNRWETQKVEHPVGVTAGWSWIYGVVAAAAAVAILAFNDFQAPPTAIVWATVVSLAFASVLLLWPIPWLMNRRAQRETDASALAAVATTTGRPPTERLAAAGLTYAYLVQPSGDIRERHPPAAAPARFREPAPRRRSHPLRRPQEGSEISLTGHARRLLRPPGAATAARNGQRGTS